MGPAEAESWRRCRLTRAVLDDYAARIRLQLQQAASGSVPLYREVE